jgi:carbonic anhydrase
MSQLNKINIKEDVPSKYINTPIGLLLEYHNLNRPFESFKKAEILIGTCMDHRVNLQIPDSFAFVIRTGGANMRNSEFHISFAFAIGNLKQMALIGHSDCGMADLFSNKDSFVKGISKNAGWEKIYANDYYMEMAPRFETGKEIEFILYQTNRLRDQFPQIEIAPMMFLVEDKRLYLINENL